MPMNKLNHLAVASLIKAGKKARTGDGGGLWLDVRAANRAAWVFRYRLRGVSHEAGLGSCSDVSLAAARDTAASYRALTAKGIDPLAHNAEVACARLAAEEAARVAAAAETITFAFAAEQRMAAMEPQLSNSKHRKQWRSTLSTYANPVFGAKPVADVDVEDVLRALKPIWLAKPETASRVRQRIEVVLDYAASRRWRSGANPATLRGNLSHLLPPLSKIRTVRHHPALPWEQLPALMEALKGVDGIGALALRFAIATAARSGEVRGATWSELDTDAAIWTIPPHRMKGRRAHSVPLNPEALDVLALMRPYRTAAGGAALVFPGSKASRGLSDMTLAAVIKRLNAAGPAQWTDVRGAPIVPHGFRSTFRDWCADTRPEPSEVIEMALAHAVGNATEAAYRRGDLLARRVPLMAAWGDFCRGQVPQNVTAIRGGGAEPKPPSQPLVRFRQPA
jgi:integrase